MENHLSAQRKISFSHLQVLSLCHARSSSPKNGCHLLPSKNVIIHHSATSLYGNSRLHSSSHRNRQLSKLHFTYLLSLVQKSLHLSSSESFQSHIHRLKSWKVFSGARRHFIWAFLLFTTTPASQPTSLNYLSIMSSQQGDLQPNAVDPTSPLPLGPDEPLPCMRGAESRRHTNNDRRKRLDELWGRGNWVPPFLHSQSREPVTAQTLFPYDLVRLCSISTHAAGNGVALPSLYQPGGLLHLFTSNRDGELTWTRDSASLALGRAIKLWKEGGGSACRFGHSSQSTSQ